MVARWPLVFIEIPIFFINHSVLKKHKMIVINIMLQLRKVWTLDHHFLTEKAW